MIDVTDKDIGRKVTYKNGKGFIAKGVITSYNIRFVYVKYGRSKHSQPTDPRKLEWVDK